MLKTLNIENSMLTPSACGYATASVSDALVVWAPYWDQLEPEPGQQDAAQLNAFDTAVSLAHTAKLATYVAVGANTPAWATVTQRKGRSVPRGRDWRLAPDDRSEKGPWADYLRLVLDRHPNVQGVIVLNEPNACYMDGRESSATVSAEMLRTAANIWRELGATPTLLGPATWSGHGALTFTEHVLAELSRTRDWADGLEVGWAHHHYSDVHAGHTFETRGVLELLRHHSHWGGDDRVWLTEGGYQFNTVHKPGFDYYADPAFWTYEQPLADQEALQSSHVAKHVSWCRTQKVAMWANYEYQDAMWGGWASGLTRADGTARPLHSRWAHL